MKKTLTSLFVVAMAGIISAQQMPLLEKSHDISRKSRKGYLGEITTNTEKNTFDMVFFLQGGGKNTLKTETYSFDKELNLTNTVKEDIELDRARKKYKKLTFRGDELLYNMTTASANLRGDLVLRKKEIRQNFNWWKGRYETYAKVLEKVKAKDEDGNKLGFLGGHYQNLITQKLILVAGDKTKENFSVFGMKDFDILSFDGDLKVEKKGVIKLSGFKIPIYSSSLIDDQEVDLPSEDFPRDWILVFAPVDGKTEVAPTNYTYCRLSSDGVIKEQIDFDAPTNGWRLLKILEKDGVVTLLGSSIEKSPTKKRFNDVFPTGTVSKVTVNASEQSVVASGIGGMFNAEALQLNQEKLNDMLDDLKYDHMAVGRIENGKYKTMSYPSIEDFEKVHQKPSDQKKFYDFDGSRFFIDETKMLSDGSIIVTGQDFNKEKVYKESYLFKFAPDGKLVANYGVNIDQKGKSNFFTKDATLTPDKVPVTNITIESQDNSKIYWFMYKAKSIDVQSETIGNTRYTYSTPMRAIQYGTIDKKTNTMGEVKDLGEGSKGEYYLFNTNNTAKLNNFTLFFSETSRGNKIMISRFDTSK